MIFARFRRNPVAAGDWHPIKTAERRRGNRILAWCVFHAGAEARICTFEHSYIGSPEDGHWYAYGMSQDVTHWMPLPGAPK